jgi:hypothetical protein
MLRRTDTPPVVVELIAQTDVAAALIDSILRVSVWREDQSENSLAS